MTRHVLPVMLVALSAPFIVCAVIDAGQPLQSPQGAEPLSLQGAAGPRLEYVDKPPRGIEIVEAFVYEKPEQAGGGVPRPQRFAANVTKLHLDVRLRELPPLGARFRYELVNDNGTFELADSLVSIARLSTQGVASMDFELLPTNGRFVTGPYRLRLYIDDVPVAVLNWSVGEATPAEGPLGRAILRDITQEGSSYVRPS